MTMTSEEKKDRNYKRNHVEWFDNQYEKFTRGDQQ